MQRGWINRPASNASTKVEQTYLNCFHTVPWEINSNMFQLERIKKHCCQVSSFEANVLNCKNNLLSPSSKKTLEATEAMPNKKVICMRCKESDNLASPPKYLNRLYPVTCNYKTSFGECSDGSGW